MKNNLKQPAISVSVEEMRPGDIAAIKEIEREASLSVWPIEDYFNELDRPDSVCLAAKHNGKVVAFSVTRLITIINSTPYSYEAELLNIAVDKTHRHASIGTKLLQALTDKLRSKNVFRIWLEVRESNTQALNFYAKHGFREKFRRQGYYAVPREDALVMCRELERQNPEQRR